MSFRGSRALARLPQLGAPCLETRPIALLYLNIERVSLLKTLLKGSITGHGTGSSSNVPIINRMYATKPVSRPKAHTGRTTSAPRQKAASTAQDKPTKSTTRRKSSGKAKSKSKPRTKAKSTKARTRAKAKPKPKRKILTEKQKAALAKKKELTHLKLLKTTALQPPSGSPTTTWQVVLSEATKAQKGNKVGSSAKEASAKFRSLTREELERYGRVATQNKAASEAEYQKWIRSHTPSEIDAANKARAQLRRQTAGRWSKLRDERLVKGPKTAYILFHSQRFRSGDFRGTSASESSKLLGNEWKGLSASEKKPFQDLAAQELARYSEEVKAVYNRDVAHRGVAKAG